MSSRPNIQKFPVIVDGDMSGSLTSTASVLPIITLGCYQYSWSGATPVGAISVEVSNDYNPRPSPDGGKINSGTWTAIYFTLNGATVVNSAPLSGNTGSGVIEFSTSASAVRTVYTRTSGTGTLQAVINCKVA
jgi:hypothetical protein